MKTEFVVLACSDKHGQKCLAGFVPGGGELLRPIGDESKGAVSKISCSVKGQNRFLRPLDVISIELADEPDFSPGQPENRRILGGGKIEFLSSGTVEDFSEDIHRLSTEGESNWFMNLSTDRIPHSDVLEQPNRPSLALKLQAAVITEWVDNYYGAKRLQFQFSNPNPFDGHAPRVNNRLKVSDHSVRFEQGAILYNQYVLGSLGEEFEGFHYKLIAGTFPKG